MRTRRFSLYCGVVFSLMACGWLVAAIFVVIDPLRIYPWGVQPVLADDYSHEAKPFLVDVAVKDANIDTLLVGSSTASPVRASLMEHTLPGTQRAFNLSYYGPSGPDQNAILEHIERYSRVKRLLLEVDWAAQVPEDDLRRLRSLSFPMFLYDDVVWNDLNGVAVMMAVLSVQAAERRPLMYQHWAYAWDEKGLTNRGRDFHTQRKIKSVAFMVAKHKADINTPAIRRCGDFDRVVNMTAAVRRIAKRGINVDVFFPLSSLAFFYDHSDVYHNATQTWSILNDHLVMRGCIVRTLDGVPGVRVFAFEDVPSLQIVQEDLSYWRDTGHLDRIDIYRQMLMYIGAGQHRLTRGNLGPYIERYRQRVLTYQLVPARQEVLQ